MDLINKVLTDALIVKPRIYEDERGYFQESFNQKNFDKIIGNKIDFVQDNESLSSKGTLRGLHFQFGKYAQTKLIRVVKGSIFDVAVDLRPNSQTYKKWYGIELSEKNRLQFLIPKGFAHGFLSLEDNTIVQYKVDQFYSPSHDGGIIFNDNTLNIAWPIIEPVLSKKDSNLKVLSEINFNNIWKE